MQGVWERQYWRCSSHGVWACYRNLCHKRLWPEKRLGAVSKYNLRFRWHAENRPVRWDWWDYLPDNGLSLYKLFEQAVWKDKHNLLQKERCSGTSLWIVHSEPGCSAVWVQNRKGVSSSGSVRFPSKRFALYNAVDSTCGNLRCSRKIQMQWAKHNQNSFSVVLVWDFGWDVWRCERNPLCLWHWGHGWRGQWTSECNSHD